jgi:hypothetical protein
MPRPALRAAALASVLVAHLAPPAAADRAAPLVEIGVRSIAPTGALGGEFSGGWETAMQLGFAVGGLALAVPAEVGGLDSRHPARDNETLVTFATGVELRGTLHQGERAGLYARAGYRWRWLSSAPSVTRRCGEVGGCDGGFWTESPRYQMNGPLIGVGATWSWANADRIRFGAAIEARLEHMRVELPGTGAVTGGLAALAVQLWIGGDARR